MLWKKKTKIRAGLFIYRTQLRDMVPSLESLSEVGNTLLFIHRSCGSNQEKTFYEICYMLFNQTVAIKIKLYLSSLTLLFSKRNREVTIATSYKQKVQQLIFGKLLNNFDYNIMNISIWISQIENLLPREKDNNEKTFSIKKQTCITIIVLNISIKYFVECFAKNYYLNS